MLAVPPPSLEELLQSAADAATGERACLWTQGDVISRALEVYGDGKRARSKLLGTFASTLHCTTNRCRQLADVSGSFGTEFRLPTIQWSLYRAIVQAAKRTNRNASEIFEETQEKDWHIAEVNALGRSSRARVLSLSADCPDCGRHISLRVKAKDAGTLAGVPIACPLCIVQLRQDNLDAREAPVLGNLGDMSGTET